MDLWRECWQKGFIPSISTPGLEALMKALTNDDPALMQGCTTKPPPLMAVQDWPVEGADAIGYCGWKGDNLATVGEVEKFFAKACFDADQRMGEVASCRHFLNWYDDTPRDEMRRELLSECGLALFDRAEMVGPEHGTAQPSAVPDDTASDLWGRKPRRRVICPGCGKRAEPYAGPFCWLCTVTGQKAFIERTTTQDDLRMAGYGEVQTDG